jgi:hypothetical protein
MNNDAELSSWQLVPVVTELLKAYNEWETISSVHESDPASVQLMAYPNPFKDEVSLFLKLDAPASTLLMVLTNTQGQEISRLEQQSVDSGEHVIPFGDLNSVRAGMYFLTAYVDGRPVKTLKLVK